MPSEANEFRRETQRPCQVLVFFFCPSQRDACWRLLFSFRCPSLGVGGRRPYAGRTASTAGSAPRARASGDSPDLQRRGGTACLVTVSFWSRFLKKSLNFGPFGGQNLKIFLINVYKLKQIFNFWPPKGPKLKDFFNKRCKKTLF